MKIDLMDKEGKSFYALSPDITEKSLTIVRLDPKLHFSAKLGEIERVAKREVITLVFHNEMSVDILIEELNKIKQVL